jgi:ATP-dependent protease ClpP protease subunit
LEVTPVWNNNCLNPLQKDLLAQNIIVISGEIDDRMYFYVYEAILRLIARGNPPVTIFITSSGGDIDIALQIFDLIHLYSGETTGIVHGWAKSGAAIILQACDTRQITPGSYIKIHALASNSLPLTTLQNADKMQEIKDRLEALQNDICELFADRAKKEAGTIWQMMLIDKMMDAKTALANGLVDKIATELPPPPHPCSGDPS